MLKMVILSIVFSLFTCAQPAQNKSRGVDVIIGTVVDFDGNGIVERENGMQADPDYNYISYRALGFMPGDVVKTVITYDGEPDNVINRNDELISHKSICMYDKGQLIDEDGNIFGYYLENVENSEIVEVSFDTRGTETRADDIPIYIDFLEN